MTHAHITKKCGIIACRVPGRLSTLAFEELNTLNSFPLVLHRYLSCFATTLAVGSQIHTCSHDSAMLRTPLIE